MIPLDGSPLLEDEARQIGEEYLERACVTIHSGQAGLPSTERSINQNAFFDSARRFSRFVRFVDRFQIAGYEVTGDVSVIYFRPRDLGGGATVLDGIKDAIAHEAPKSGWSNEWLLQLYFRPYSPHDTNIFGLPTFADYYDIWEPGQWFAPEMTSNDELLWHVSYGARVPTWGNLIAEGVSGYNYARLDTAYAGNVHLNQTSCGPGDDTCVNFYKSRQIYKPPYEIDACETVRVDGEDLVKVTLTGRLQNTLGETDGVPSGDISRETSTWTAATIAAEPYRTDENALRLYILHAEDGYNPPPTTGDCALNGSPYSLYDSVFASIIPTVCLLQLMPLPYDDGNDTAQRNDSQTAHDWFLQAEWYLRAMCEGFVDPSSSALLGCNVDDPDGTMGTGDESCLDTGLDLFDYTFENLVVDATDGRLSAFITLPTQTTDRLGETDVVANPWPSYGPLPNTPRSAEVFNLYSACINKLTRARVMLPYSFEAREVTYASAALAVAAMDICEPAVGCGVGLGKNVWIGTGLPATTLVSDSGWFDSTGTAVHALIGAGFDNGICHPSGDYQVTAARTAVSFRFTLTDADAINAIPDAWRDLFTSDAIGTMFCVWRYDQNYRWNTGVSTPCNGPFSFGCGFEEHVVESTSCQFIRQGTVDFGAYPPGGLHAVGWNGANQCTYNPERHWYAYPVSGRTIYVQVPVVGLEDDPQPGPL